MLSLFTDSILTLKWATPGAKEGELLIFLSDMRIGESVLNKVEKVKSIAMSPY